MMLRTHLIISTVLCLFFLPSVDNKFLFVPILFISTLIPDVDSYYSFLGKFKLFRPLQFFVKHRGVLHSLTICLIFSFIFAFYIPILAFPFFLGYSFHLFADSFTKEGIKPYWPFSANLEGWIITGSSGEKFLFYAFCVISGVLVIFLFI